MLSSYRIMWMLVMFDLPVIQRKERKEATDFRNALLDMGFEMSQFSVYMRFCTSHAQVESFCLKIHSHLPKGGKVHILQFTDKQYERIITYQGRLQKKMKNKPDQFDLF